MLHSERQFLISVNYQVLPRPYGGYKIGDKQKTLAAFPTIR